MSDADGLNGRRTDSIPDGGILAALPRARPQRASARREAARASTATKAKPTPAKTKPANARATRVAPAKAKASVKSATPKKPTTARRRGPKPIAKPPEPPAPKQGYEPEEEVELGTSVHPPSGVELVESVADIVGELAGSSFAAGGRLLKDALSLLRRP